MHDFLTKWLPLLMTVAIPVVATADSGRERIAKLPAAVPVWACTIAFFAAGAAFVALGPNTPDGVASHIVLFSVPLMQLIFVASTILAFEGFAGRALICFDESRYGRTPGGKRLWVDIWVWMAIYLGMAAIGAVGLVSAGIELPPRR